MRLSSGSIVINQGIGAVFTYCADLANLAKQLEIEQLDDYEIELDDDIAGPMSEGQEITLYFFAKYEDDKSFMADLAVCRLKQDAYIVLKITRVARYENDDDEYDDVKELPMSVVWNKFELGVLFQAYSDATKVKLVTYVYPTAGIRYKLMFFVFNFFGKLINRRYLKEWKQLIEFHG